MPVFYFDLIDGDSITEDVQGKELQDLGSARQTATRHLIEAARDLLPDEGEGRDISVRVRDSRQDQVLEVSIVFKVHNPPGSMFPLGV